MGFCEMEMGRLTGAFKRPTSGDVHNQSTFPERSLLLNRRVIELKADAAPLRLCECLW